MRKSAEKKPAKALVEPMRQPAAKKRAKAAVRLERAKRNYQKIMKDLEPFLPKEPSGKPAPQSQWKAADTCVTQRIHGTL
jgi:hypothetical protein